MGGLQHSEGVDPPLGAPPAWWWKEAQEEAVHHPQEEQAQEEEGKTPRPQVLQVDDSGKVTRLRKECPIAGAGHFMANHADRYYSGKTGHTIFIAKSKK